MNNLPGITIVCLAYYSSIGVFVATEEGMDRAVRAIEDVYRAENAHKGGGTGSSSSSSSGSC